MARQKPYRVVIADDHAMFRQDLKCILIMECEVEVVGEACDGQECLDLLEGMDALPQLVILDISMPRLGGIETAASIKTAHPEIKVLILSMHQESAYVEKAFSSGANGYLLKKDSGPEIAHAVEKIRQGQNYLSPSIFPSPYS